MTDHAAPRKYYDLVRKAQRDYEQIPTGRELSGLLEESRLLWVTGIISSVIVRSKRTWGSLITVTAARGRSCTRSAATCKTASGLREKANYPLRRCLFRETCSAPAHKLLICLEDDGEYLIFYDNSPIGSNVEGALRRMKKILLPFFGGDGRFARLNENLNRTF